MKLHEWQALHAASIGTKRDEKMTIDQSVSRLVELPPPFENDAGSIQNLLEEPCGGVSVIYSRAGSIRSNHWHREDSHHLFVLRGSMYYFERPIGADWIPEPTLYVTGKQVYTPSRVEHATYFPTDTVLISMSARPRDTRNHEDDVVRVEFLTIEKVRKVLGDVIIVVG